MDLSLSYTVSYEQEEIPLGPVWRPPLDGLASFCLFLVVLKFPISLVVMFVHRK